MFKMLNATQETSIEDWSELVKIALREEPYSSKLIYAVSLLIVFFASLVGNILTCIVIYCDKTMHTATNYYLFNLAISDILATFTMLLIIYQLLIIQTEFVEFKYGLFASKFFFCIHYIFVTLLWNNGILVLTVLSIERYIAICYPMMLKGALKRRVGKIIVAIWTIAILETLPQLWTMELVSTDTALMCFSLPTPTSKIITGTLAMVTFIVPLGILIFVYTMIAFKINGNQKYNLRDTVYKNGFKRKNVNKLIVTLTVSFLVCWLPFFLIRMTMFATSVEELIHFYRWFAIAHKVAMFNSWLTTVLNPLLLSLMSMKFRKALKMLWERKIRKRYSQTKRTKTIDTHF